MIKVGELAEMVLKGMKRQDAPIGVSNMLLYRETRHPNAWHGSLVCSDTCLCPLKGGWQGKGMKEAAEARVRGKTPPLPDVPGQVGVDRHKTIHDGLSDSARKR